MKIAITGTRSQQEAIAFPQQMHEALAEAQPELLVLGDATGIDRMAQRFAQSLLIPYVEEKANWIGEGRAAGPRRNSRMLDHKPDEVWYFHLDFENSKGTKNCVEQARARGIPVRAFDRGDGERSRT